MHFLIKSVLRPAITQLAKLKTEDGETIEDQAEKLERWVGHYSKLYVQDHPEHPGTEEVSPSFGVYAESDEEPTEEDGIPAEKFKENTDVLLPRHALLLQCW